MKILKLTDVDFMKDQKYILTLEISGEHTEHLNNVNIGLYRIAQCSNYG